MIVTAKVYDKSGNLVDYLVCQHSYDLKDFPLSKKDGVLSYLSKLWGIMSKKRVVLSLFRVCFYLNMGFKK